MDKRLAEFLEKLEVRSGHSNPYWNIPAETGKFLNILVRSVQAKAVLEVGTSNGYSGLWFAEALSHTGGKLYTVESHQERYALAIQNFRAAGVESFVEQIFGHAPEVFLTPEFAARNLLFDVIFLDATKIEYNAYFQNVLPLLKSGGVLIADNVLSHADELPDFMAAVEKNSELTSVVVPIGSGVLMAVKN